MRLAEIDAPELKTEHGPAARSALSGMVSNKVVVVRWRRRGRYRRIIGQVYLDDVWMNLRMVEQGWVWQFRRYSTSSTLAKAEEEARKGLLGMWRRLGQL